MFRSVPNGVLLHINTSKDINYCNCKPFKWNLQPHINKIGSFIVTAIVSFNFYSYLLIDDMQRCTFHLFQIKTSVCEQEQQHILACFKLNAVKLSSDYTYWSQFLLHPSIWLSITQSIASELSRFKKVDVNKQWMKNVKQVREKEIYWRDSNKINGEKYEKSRTRNNQFHYYELMSHREWVCSMGFSLLIL